MPADAAQLPHALPADRPQAPPASPAGRPQVAQAAGARLGPYSRAHRLRGIDRRTRLGQHLTAFEAGLIEAVGGAPPLPVRALISQAVTLECQIRLLEHAGIRTDHDRRCLSSWLGAQRHALKAIAGLKGAAAERGPSLREYLEAKRAATTPSPPEAA